MAFLFNNAISSAAASVFNSVPYGTERIIAITLTGGHTIQMPAETLIYCSEYFANELSGSYTKLTLSTLHLGGVSYSNWCYFEEFARHGHFTEASEEQLAAPILKAEEYELDFMKRGTMMVGKDDVVLEAYDLQLARLIKMFRLGEYLRCPSFMNAVMDKVVKHFAERYEIDQRVPLELETIPGVYTPKDNKLYRFTLEVVLYVLTEKSYEFAVTRGYVSTYFYLDLCTLKHVGRHTNSTPPWKSLCRSHKHPPGEFNSPCITRNNWDAVGVQELIADRVFHEKEAMANASEGW